jgi:DNA polymerase-3 subunit epsilon
MPLFGDDAAAETAPATPAPIADWQVHLLRKALDARQLGTMTERRQAIEAAAGRPVESLRALTHDEALKVLSTLGPAPTTQSGSPSAWDQRDEDTWIDRL